jgi:Tol biopolymer transport system component
MPAEGDPEKHIGLHTWYSMSQTSYLQWLPDGRGLIAIAAVQSSPSQVWYVSYPGGEARRITNDLNSYSGLSLTGDASALVAVQSETTSRVWVGSTGDPASVREITRGRQDGGNGVAWVGDGNIVFTAPDSSQNMQVWITAADGTGRRQITMEGSYNALPAVCGGGRYLVFVSDRAGTPHIWRSDIDGSNARQLTNGESEWYPSCAPDGTWITYGTRTPNSVGVSRIPIDGGAPVRIWDRYGQSQISPDGKSILVKEFEAVEPKVRIIPASGGDLIRTFDLNSDFGGSRQLEWAEAGAALLYARTSGGVSNIWRRPVDGGEPKQVTNFTSDEITWFAVSRDGKRLALARGTTTSDVVMIRDVTRSQVETQ